VPEPAVEADLYEVDPARFTDARNALVKRLRADGQRDEAARVAKLRRPPVTAWALNQVARHQPDLIRAVLDTGDRLRAAMTNAVAGDASDLRNAQSEQRRAVDAAVTAAADRLRDAGHPAVDTNKQRMGATLGAAVVDDAVASRLREGVLESDRSAPGFGLDATSVPASRPVKAAKAAKAAEAAEPARDPDSARQEQREDKEKAADQPEATAIERERRRQARLRHAELETRADRMARRAERLEKHADEAERLAAQARRAAEEAMAEAARARSKADEARVGYD
jgi:hypothetical protein